MGTDLWDNKGLICGFRVPAQSSAVEIALDDLDPLTPPDVPLWLHFNLNDARAIHWLSECLWLNAGSRETLMSSDLGVHFEVAEDHAVGALADLVADDPDRVEIVHIYFDRTCLISARHHQAMSLGALRRDLSGGMALDGSTAALFDRIVEDLLATLRKAVRDYATVVDDAEDRVFASGSYEEMLGQHRRAMARLRRQVSANRHAIADFSGHPPPWWQKPTVKALRGHGQALASLAQDLELVEERARLLNEEIHNRLAEKANNNLYFVSLAAAVFLPVTLVSGIFGMNVGGLPWVDSSHGFIWTMLCMLIVIVIALLLLHWRRML